jgi:hypothetical protein
MREKHAEEAIFEFENCVECHPTGLEGEAERLHKGRAGQEREEQSLSDARRATSHGE